MKIQDILELLQDIATDYSQELAFRTEYLSQETDEEFTAEIATERRIIGIMHDCSRAVALHNGGYYRHFTKRTISVLKEVKLYSQDIHNFMAMWDAQNNH